MLDPHLLQFVVRFVYRLYVRFLFNYEFDFGTCPKNIFFVISKEKERKLIALYHITYKETHKMK